ncbi:MAG: D-alanyl-D-alanine dipeptidase [Elainella sp. Prado103]|jgi:D-alanyl-D-alanine dipeptidase|nr:D-alanyl-D-alanine dipeptidase [Elainella sp. Prado103]
MKPYQQVPIQDCHEPLVPIPLAVFAVETPHPYVKLGAPYGDRSPYYVRQGVLDRLQQAQLLLQQRHPGWRIQIFDAYRPIAVQQFMVDRSIQQAIAEKGWHSTPWVALSEAQQQAILAQVQQFWAIPSPNPATPPPHSTGGAIDLTLSDATGKAIDMGSPIDEMSPRSYPNYYAALESVALESDPDSNLEADLNLEQNLEQNLAQSPNLPPDGNAFGTDRSSPYLAIQKTLTGQQRSTGFTHTAQSHYHQNRLLLRQIMVAVGFQQHPQEWWHFSYGDQLWAWLSAQQSPHFQPIAHYGGV